MAKPTDQSDPAEPRRGFSRRDRLTHAREFQRVYAERAKKGAVGGAFALHARLNGLDRCRLGLAVGRRCGGAVVRNRIKRRVREAFRLARGAWSPSMDLVVVASPHEPMKPEQYAEKLSACIEHLTRVLVRRSTRREGNES